MDSDLFKVSKPQAITTRVNKILDSFSNHTKERRQSEINSSYGINKGKSFTGRMNMQNASNCYGVKPGLRTNFPSQERPLGDLSK